MTPVPSRANAIKFRINNIYIVYLRVAQIEFYGIWISLRVSAKKIILKVQSLKKIEHRVTIVRDFPS